MHHDLSLKDMHIQKLLKENSDLKEENNTKDYKIKQLRYENDRLFNECSTLKNIQTMSNTSLGVNSFQAQ